MIQADERNPTLTRNPISPSLRSQMHHIRLGMYFVINRRTGKTRRHAMSITRLSSLTGPITISHPKSKFPVPASTQTVGVRIIDSTTSIENLQLKFLMKPPIDGLEYLPPLPSWSFLIEHPSGKNVLYDLVVARNWRSFLLLRDIQKSLAGMSRSRKRLLMLSLGIGSIWMR